MQFMHSLPAAYMLVPSCADLFLHSWLFVLAESSSVKRVATRVVGNSGQAYLSWNPMFALGILCRPVSDELVH